MLIYGLLAAVMAALFPTTAASQPQPVVGQTVEALGTTYEIVSFEFVLFDTGELYEVLLPAQVHEHDTLGVTLSVSPASSPIGDCFGDRDPNGRVGGNDAYLTNLTSVDMIHQAMSVPQVPAMEHVENRLMVSALLRVSVAVGEATCVTLNLANAVVHRESDSDRGVHDMAYTRQPRQSDMDAYADTLQDVFLHYVDFRRVRR